VDEIVYGGEDILARTIREVKDLPISALFVLSACGPEIVGRRYCSGMRNSAARSEVPDLFRLNGQDSEDRSIDGIDIGAGYDTKGAGKE